jgi:hypothetical protein
LTAGAPSNRPETATAGVVGRAFYRRRCRGKSLTTLPLFPDARRGRRNAPEEEGPMAARERASMSDIVGRYEDELLPEWVQHQLEATTLRRDLIRDDELREQSRR